MLFEDCFLTMALHKKIIINTITRNAKSPLILAKPNNNSATLNNYSVAHNTFFQSICLSSQEEKKSNGKAA